MSVFDVTNTAEEMEQLIEDYFDRCTHRAKLTTAEVRQVKAIVLGFVLDRHIRKDLVDLIGKFQSSMDELK